MLIPESIAGPIDAFLQPLAVAPDAPPGKALAVDVIIVAPFILPGGSRQQADLAARMFEGLLKLLLIVSRRNYTLLFVRATQ